MEKIPQKEEKINPPGDNTGETKGEKTPTPARVRRHAIRPRWLRIILKTMMWIVIVILLIPVLLYLPPVQDLAVNVTTNFVRKSTGMDIHIGRFRLGFPLDVHLQDVSILTAPGDTMVRAGEAIADVRLMPLLHLDVKLNKLELVDGYYRMVSSDSSMIMAIRAGHLTADDKSSFDLARMRLMLNKVRLTRGDVALYMNVWKKKPAPEDTTSSTPFYIQANDLVLEDFGFGMSMLPTIDTLDLRTKRVELKNGVVDLGKNLISWRLAAISDGSVKYLTPDPEWAKAHPAPPSEPSTGPPMRIMGDSIALRGLAATYATRGVKPAPGFDPSYIAVTGVDIGMRKFYNESSTVRLPLTLLRASERSGLRIVNGHGTIGIDSVGLTLDNVNIRTLFSQIAADADVPFAVMAMDEHTPMRAKAQGQLGMPDIEAFMPAVREYTARVPRRKPLRFNVDANGTLARLDIRRLEAEMAGVLSLKADGYANNALNYKKMQASIRLDGSLFDPSLAAQFLPESEMRIPAFRIKGNARANGLNYGADLTMTTTAGDLAARGEVALTPERYKATVDATRLNVAAIMPSLGIGRVTAHVDATGAGFNPVSGKAVTDAKLRLASIEYKHREYKDIRADVLLQPDGALQLLLTSANPGLNLEFDGSGVIRPDDYTIDMVAHINDLDLQSLGLSDSICKGKGTIYLNGTASPGKWLYDADIKLVDIDWNLPDTYIHLPGGLQASLKADDFSTFLNLQSHLVDLNFRSPTGLQNLITAFTATADTVMRQIATKNIAVDALSNTMPRFTLDVNASGRGLLAQLLKPQGISIDTIWGHFERDSIFSGNLCARALDTGAFRADTLDLNMSERGQLLDYRAHMGNRAGTLDEFARVNLSGYLGNNRISAFLTQRNISNEMGYRLGLTASVVDSIVSVHFTPLKSTIAYMPWTLNADNYVDYNLRNMRVEANLQAVSQESSILARTEKDADNNNVLRLKIADVHIEDFLRMTQTAPPVRGIVSSDLTVQYREQSFNANGFLTVNDLIYDRNRLGNFDLDIAGRYAMHSGAANGMATLRVNGRPAVIGYAAMSDGETGGMAADSIGVRLDKFPLDIVNAFLGKTASVSGYANGDMRMEGDVSNPRLNGYVTFDSTSVAIPMFGAKLRLDNAPVSVKDNILQLEDYDIWAANDNPLTLNGTVNASSFGNIIVDFAAHANNMQLIKSDKRSRADLFGKIFLNLDATARGPLSRLNIDGNVNILGTTDATYRLNMTPGELSASSDQDVVRFVNFNDSVDVAQADTVATSSLNMRVNANLVISPGARFEVLLSTNATDKVTLSPSANLHYSQSYLGDMNLTGTLTLGEGFARYAIPIAGEKMFTFDPNSTITWTGNVLNPTLNVTATDKLKANVTQNGNSRLVNFLVTLNATNTVDRLNVGFDLSTNDDLTIQNELQSMSTDQRQTQAMNLLLYGQYQGAGGTKANANIGGNMLYSLLESQLNQLTAKYIRGVDLSFGVDQYERAENGARFTETSYSYQVSKSLFNNRFRIQVGGNYSTDQSAEDNLAQNLISDVSFEYIIKQSATQNMSVQLFRRQNYESILEGEITETGVAFVLKRKLGNLFRLFKKRKKKKPAAEQAADSVALPVKEQETDTIITQPK